MESLQNRIATETSSTETGTRANLSIVLAVLSVVLAILTIAITIRILYICYSPVPWADTWDYWAWAQKYSHHPFWHLADQHTEHRIPVGRLFLLFDQFVFAGTAKSLAVFIPLVQLAHATVLAYLISLVPGIRASTRWFLGAVAFATAFSLQQFANFTWYFQLWFLGVFFGASLCCLTMSKLIHEESSSPKNARRSTLWLLLTIALAVATTYSLANGLAIWPVLLMYAFYGKLSPSKQLALFCAGALTCWAFLHGYAPRPEASTPADALSHPGAFFRFLLVILGNPFSDIFSALGRHVSMETLFLLAGGLGVVSLLAAGLVFILWGTHARRQTAQQSTERSSSEAALIHILLFFLLGVVLIAVGRLKFPVSEALTSRYATPSLLVWLLLAVLLIIQCERRASRRAGLAGDSLKGLVIVVLIAFLVCNKPARTSYARSYAAHLRESEVAIGNDVFDPPKWKTIYYDVDSMLKLADYLRANKLAMFHEPGFEWEGDEIAKHYRITDRRCRGAIDIVTPVISSRPGYRLEGWASSAVSEPTSMVIILTDSNGKIIGSALGGVSRPDVALALKEPSATNLGWIGYISGFRAKRCVAYLLVGHRNEACEVGSKDLAQIELR
jgi:hypothetical protein